MKIDQCLGMLSLSLRSYSHALALFGKLGETGDSVGTGVHYTQVICAFMKDFHLQMEDHSIVAIVEGRLNDDAVIAVDYFKHIITILFSDMNI